MIDVTFIHVPIWKAVLVLLVPVAVLTVLAGWVRRVLGDRNPPAEERDWSVPGLEAGARTSVFHRWDVRCKLVTLLVYGFLVASLDHLPVALAAAGVSALALVTARVPVARALVRLAAVSGFLIMLGLILPLTVPAHPGDTLLGPGRPDWLVFNLRGLGLAATIAAKAVAIALLMEPLLATAPLPVTLHGLSRLGAPEMVGQMVLLSHRYLHVFRHEARRMTAGMRVRGFEKRTDVETLRAVANFLGMLFVRSFERTERVFDAMRARGYRGRFPDAARLRLRTMDLLFSLVWVIVGTALVVCDRMVV